MKIYYLTMWGNEEEGPDGSDTSYLVAAKDYISAAVAVDQRLSDESKSNIHQFCNRVTELGSFSSDSSEVKIIVGPIVEHALYHDDLNLPNSHKWVRDSTDEGWVSYSEYYEE